MLYRPEVEHEPGGGVNGGKKETFVIFSTINIKNTKQTNKKDPFQEAI